MIKEFERVVLKEDLKGTQYIKGDVGTVVTIYPDNKGYEVEFFALDGSTISVETVMDSQLIPANAIKKVLHVDSPKHPVSREAADRLHRHETNNPDITNHHFIVPPQKGNGIIK
jgi:hypothetical protein